MSTAQKCERCREYNAAAVDFRNQAANAQSDLADLLARHNALVEAVAWWNECIDFVNIFYIENDKMHPWILTTCLAARAEVDRLLRGE